MAEADRPVRGRDEQILSAIDTIKDLDWCLPSLGRIGYMFNIGGGTFKGRDLLGLQEPTSNEYAMNLTSIEHFRGNREIEDCYFLRVIVPRSSAKEREDDDDDNDDEKNRTGGTNQQQKTVGVHSAASQKDGLNPMQQIRWTYQVDGLQEECWNVLRVPGSSIEHLPSFLQLKPQSTETWAMMRKNFLSAQAVAMSLSAYCMPSLPDALLSKFVGKPTESQSSDGPNWEGLTQSDTFRSLLSTSLYVRVPLTADTQPTIATRRGKSNSNDNHNHHRHCKNKNTDKNDNSEKSNHGTPRTLSLLVNAKLVELFCQEVEKVVNDTLRVGGLNGLRAVIVEGRFETEAGSIAQMIVHTIG